MEQAPKILFNVHKICIVKHASNACYMKAHITSSIKPQSSANIKNK